MLFDIPTFTLIHVVLSLIGIFSGLVVVGGLIALPIAVAARYWNRLTGPWRKVFVVTTVLALYFNIFVLPVQLFQKMPALIVLAPTQKEPPFLVTQLVVLALFVWMGRAAVKGFRPLPAARAG